MTQASYIGMQKVLKYSAKKSKIFQKTAMTDDTQQNISFAEFELDKNRRRLLCDGEPVVLYAKAFDLLNFLIERNGRVVSKNEILDSVWPNQFVEEANLSVQISALRKALGEKKNEPRFLVTVPGKGYKFVADIRKVNGHSAVSNGTAENGNDGIVIKKKEEIDKTVPQTDATSSRWKIISAAVTGVLLALAGFGLYRLYRSEPPARVPAETEKLRQLTTKGRVGLAAISPDGQFYVYSLHSQGEYTNSLWVAQVDGGNDIQLLPPDDNRVRSVTFSQDGKSVIFSLGNSDGSPGGLYKMPVLGGVPEKITDRPLGRFNLSPDGKQIAYFRSYEDRSALLVANLDGTDEREIISRPLETPFVSREPAWSPDGSLLAASSITDTAKQSHEIFVVRVADGYIEQLTSLDWISVQNLIWRRDGRGLIIVAIDKNETLRHLWQVGYPGGEISRVSSDTDSYGSALSLSGDGKSLIATQVRIESNIWLAPAGDLSKARQITFSSINGAYGWFGVEWTPDNRLVFVAGVDRNRAIFSIGADGGDLRQITSGGFYDHRPDVSPDGSFVVFGSNRSGMKDIWRVNIDGTGQRQLTTDGSNSTPVVTPDGKTIVYVSIQGGKQTLWRIPAEGGVPSQLTQQESTDPNISPDGKFIACGYNADDAPLRLAILKFEDGSVVKTFDMPRSTNFNGGIKWMPDGKAITIRDWANGIWKQDIDSDRLTRLEGLPEEKLYGYDWSPDGKTLVFSRGREIADAVLLRLFNAE